MGIKAIYKGIGKGSLFGHGRFIIHNPLGSRLGKAMDPYINLGTLSRLSRSEKIEVRNAVEQNITGRLRAPLSKACVDDIFRRINRDMISRVLSNEAFIDKGVQDAVSAFMAGAKKYDLRNDHYRRALIMIASVPSNVNAENSLIAFSLLAEDITTNELELIAMLGPSLDVANIMASDKVIPDALFRGIPKKMSRRAFLLLGLHDHGTDNGICLNVFLKLEKGLTRKELDFLSVSKSKRMQERICLTGLSSPQAVANAVLGMTAGTGAEYDMKYLEKASLLIAARVAQANEILSYLIKADANLTNLIIKRMSQSKGSPMIIEPRNSQ